MRVIVNTTIVSNFASVGRLDILHRLLGDVYLSTDVYAEIQNGMASGYDFYTGIEAHIHPLTPDGWLRLTSLSGEIELGQFGVLLATLHRGEASSLAIASARGWAFLTDDRLARRLAREREVPVSGTLGVLIQAVKKDLLSLEAANALLGQMIEHGYHSPAVSLAEYL